MPPFDVHEFAATTHGSLRAELPDVGVFDAGSAELVETLRRSEAATMAHLRNVLVTPTHKDARVTAFLVSWAFEKFWIADALNAISSGGPSVAGAHLASSRTPGPLRRSVAGAFSGTAVVAAHMTQGLIDDTILDAAYDELAGRVDGLRPLTERIRAVKSRHTRFFAEEAERRLAASARSVRVTRRVLHRESQPIGSGTWTNAQRAGFAEAVFGSGRGAERAEHVAQTIAALPGVGADAARRLVDRNIRNLLRRS